MNRNINLGGNLKCVLVGDSTVGKTSLIVAYTTNGFCERYSPTAYDNYSVSVTADNKPLKIELCDTSGQSEFDSLRLLAYNESNVFLLCFSVISQESLQSVIQKWLPEIRTVAPDVPIILVGTQSDLRHNLGKILEMQRKGLHPVDLKYAKKLSDQYNMEYIECSALTQHNLKEVFDLAIVNALSKRKNKQNTVHEKQRTQTTFKQSFKKLFTYTKRLIE